MRQHLTCPQIQLNLERNKSERKHYICRRGDGVEFEVDHHTKSWRVVNMRYKNCSCGQWQVSAFIVHISFVQNIIPAECRKILSMTTSSLMHS